MTVKEMTAAAGTTREGAAAKAGPSHITPSNSDITGTRLNIDLICLIVTPPKGATLS